MLTRYTRWLAPFAVALAFITAPAGADEVADLRQEADRLNGDLASLRTQLAQTAGANYETRLAAFEQELRNLTGMIEQLGYQQNQLSQRLDRMQADYEYRLSTLEGGAPVGAAPSAAPSSGGGTTAGSSSSGTPQGDVKTLGTISQDQLATTQQGSAGAYGTGAPQPLGAATPSTTQSAGLPGGTPKEQYDHAFGLLRKADYAGAETALTQFIQANPGDPLVANAKYWLGETYYVRGNYQAAASAFGVAYQDHPQGPKAVDSLLKLGLSLSLMGQGGDACAVFGELERRFPTAPANVLQRSVQERGRLGC
jgi:tol-pal system protein YbgF